MVHMPGRTQTSVVWELKQSVNTWIKTLRAVVCVACASGNADYCTPQVYKECADPALGKKSHLPADIA